MLEPSRFIIYGLIDPFSKELRYIGQSSYGFKRAKAHSTKHVLQQNHNPHKCNWIKSLKENGLYPEIEIIENLQDSSQLDEAEIFWIAYFKYIGCALLNAHPGGSSCRGYKMSQETRQKLSNMRKGNKNHRWGKRHSDETRKKISESRKGQHLGRKRPPRTPEWRFNSAVAHLKTPPFRCLNNNKIYYSKRLAAEELGIDRTCIYDVLNGKMKSVKGFVFQYLNAAQVGA